MLRFIIILAATVAIFSVTAEDFEIKNGELYIYEEQINETINNLSRSLSEHDPLSIPKINFNFKNDVGYVDFEAEDILVIGFSKFWATDLRISVIPPSARFNIQFDKIQVVVPYYKLDGLVVFVPFYGSGNMNLRTTVIHLGGSAKILLGSEGGSASVTDVKVRFNLEKSDLQISGLLHNEPLSQIVSTATTECFPEFVNTYGERLGLLVAKRIEKLINDALNGSSTENNDMSLSQNSDTIKIGNATIKYYYQL